jgi:hypothetical protein
LNLRETVSCGKNASSKDQETYFFCSKEHTTPNEFVVIRVGHPLKHPKVTQSQQTKQLLGGLLTGCTIACMQTGKYHQRKSVSHLFLQLLETCQPTNHSETAVLAYLTVTTSSWWQGHRIPAVPCKLGNGNSVISVCKQE